MKGGKRETWSPPIVALIVALRNWGCRLLDGSAADLGRTGHKGSVHAAAVYQCRSRRRGQRHAPKDAGQRQLQLIISTNIRYVSRRVSFTNTQCRPREQH